MTARVEKPVNWATWNETISVVSDRRVETTLPPDGESTTTTTSTSETRGQSGAKGVRWSGWLTAPVTEEYSFVLLGAEGSRLYIGNDLLIHTERPGIPGHVSATLFFLAFLILHSLPVALGARAVKTSYFHKKETTHDPLTQWL